MKPDKVANAVREAFDKGRYEATRHFWYELRADGFMLTDLHSAFDAITTVVEMGEDYIGNPKFEVTGSATDGRTISVVCSFKETGVVLLITVYEGTRP